MNNSEKHTKGDLLDCCVYWLRELELFTSCEETKQLIRKRLDTLKERQIKWQKDKWDKKMKDDNARFKAQKKLTGWQIIEQEREDFSGYRSQLRHQLDQLEQAMASLNLSGNSMDIKSFFNELKRLRDFSRGGYE